MQPVFIAIAGGSGSGKSTLTNALQDHFLNELEFVHFDDYQKEEADVAMTHNMKNWDHPQAIDFAQLEKDLTDLKAGKNVLVMTKNRRINPEYETSGRVPHTMKPKKIILVEGYMTLVNKEIRRFFDHSVFLDLPIQTALNRRDKVTYNAEDEYNQKILIPMHQEFIVPSKTFADTIINVEEHSADQVFGIVKKIIENKFL